MRVQTNVFKISLTEANKNKYFFLKFFFKYIFKFLPSHIKMFFFLFLPLFQLCIKT